MEAIDSDCNRPVCLYFGKWRCTLVPRWSQSVVMVQAQGNGSDIIVILSLKPPPKVQVRTEYNILASSSNWGIVDVSFRPNTSANSRPRPSSPYNISKTSPAPPVQSVTSNKKMAQVIKDVLNPWSAAKIPDLGGKVAVITGGNEGIGAAFVSELLKHNLSKVFILSNDAARHKEAVEYFSKEAGKDVSSQVVFHELDLGDYDAVKKAVEKIKKDTDRVDILDLSAAM